MSLNQAREYIVMFLLGTKMTLDVSQWCPLHPAVPCIAWLVGTVLPVGWISERSSSDAESVLTRPSGGLALFLVVFGNLLN